MDFFLQLEREQEENQNRVAAALKALQAWAPAPDEEEEPCRAWSAAREAFEAVSDHAGTAKCLAWLGWKTEQDVHGALRNGDRPTVISAARHHAEVTLAVASSRLEVSRAVADLQAARSADNRWDSDPEIWDPIANIP